MKRLETSADKPMAALSMTHPKSDTRRDARADNRFSPRGGYAVDMARDIDAALAAVARHNPDVILLDVVRPGGDGFTLCRRLKIDAATRLTLVTALADRENI